MTLNELLENTAKAEKYRSGYEGNMTVEEFSETPRFEASTHMVTNEITEKYNPEYEEQNPGKTVPTIRDITRHEINHHKFANCIGCPQTLDKHVELFYEPMLKVLSPKGFSQDDTHYATNALEDTLLHKDLNVNEHCALDGITNFFEEVGRYTKATKEGKHKFTKFYEAHVKLNMYLWGNKQQKKVMKQYYTHDKKITEVLQAFLEKTNKYDFLNEKHWKYISEVYAEEFSKLMEPNYAMPLFNHSGSGTKGKESKTEGKQKPNSKEKENQSKPKNSQEGNIFDKQMRTKEYQKSRVQKAYNNNEKAPDWISQYDAMDLLYESLAQKLIIKSKTYTQEEQLPIAWYGKRDFNPEKDNLKHITFGMNEEGKLGLRKKVFHEDIPIQVKHKPESFPRLKFGIIDTSSSMKHDVNGGYDVGNTKIIPWGDKSRYHFALLGWYGFLEYLKSNHLLVQNTVDLANFSSTTITGSGLQEAKKVALSPQFGNTYIDMDIIKHFFEGRDNLIFTMSDGEIGNWPTIKDDFITNAQKHQYFHIQIGTDSETTKDLEEAGLYVAKVMGNKDLAEKVIDLTDKNFRKEN